MFGFIFTNTFWLRAGAFLFAGGKFLYDDHCCCGCSNCDDGSTPTCANGSNATCSGGVWTCADSSTPSCCHCHCVDGAPECSNGDAPKCNDGSPTCSGDTCVCDDGSNPQPTGPPCTTCVACDVGTYHRCVQITFAADAFTDNVCTNCSALNGATVVLCGVPGNCCCWQLWIKPGDASCWIFIQACFGSSFGGSIFLHVNTAGFPADSSTWFAAGTGTNCGFASVVLPFSASGTRCRSAPTGNTTITAI